MKTLLMIAILSLSHSLFAQTIPVKKNPNYEQSIDVSYVKDLVKILESKKTSKQARELLLKVIGPQKYEVRYSIMSVVKDYSLGTVYTTYLIGIDDLDDDDNGWGAVYRLDVTETRNELGDQYEISEVELIHAAG